VALLQKEAGLRSPARKGGIGKVSRKQKEPIWKKAVIASAVVLGIAIGVFCLVQVISFRNFAVLKNFNRAAEGTDISPTDIIAMTASILSGLIGWGVLMWKYHKTEEERRTKIRERRDAAYKSLWNERCLSAIDELEELLEDSPRDSEKIVRYLTEYLESDAESGQEVPDLPIDYEEAALLLGKALRRTIEAKAKDKRLPQRLIYATKVLCDFTTKYGEGYQFFQWENLRAGRMNLEGITLKCAILKGAVLRRARLEDTEFTGAHLRGADLRKARLEGAYFSSADLKGVDLRYAHLEGADLRYAHLEGADLRYAHLEGVLFLEEAYIDEDTQLDPGIREQYFGEEEPEHR